MIPAQVTREIINEGIPSTFESLHGGAALALKDINPSELLEFTNFSGLLTGLCMSAFTHDHLGTWIFSIFSDKS